MRRLCIALLLLNLLYCSAALISGRGPAWNMFERVEDLRYDVRDRDGRAVDVYDYLPGSAYLLNREELDVALACIARKAPARAPLKLVPLPEQAPLP